MQRKKPMFYSALLLTGVNLLLRLFSTSFQVYLSGRIGAAGVGLLQLVMSLGAMAMTAGMAGARTAVMYLTAEELGKKRPGNVHWILRGGFLYSLICSGTVGLALYLLAPVLASGWIGDPAAAGALELLAVFLPVSCLCGVMSGYFTAANRIGTLAAVEIAEQLCCMTVTVAALSLWAGDDPGRACQAVVLGSCLGTCMSLSVLVVLRIRESVKRAGPVPVAGRLVDAAVPLALADDLRTGIGTAENMMVPRRLSLYPGADNPMALFGTVCGMVFPVMMFPAAILYGLTELLIPELARCNAAGSRTRISYLVRRSLRVTVLYGIFFCGLLFLLAEPLCRLLYGSTDAGRYLRWFSLLVPVLYCDGITDAMIKGLGQQKISVRYNILTSCLDIVLLYFLLPRYGIGGYFASFCGTHLLNFILSLRRLLKITGHPFSARVPLLAGMALAAALLLSSLPREAGFRAVAFCGILPSLLVLLRVVSAEDMTWIRSLMHQK